MKYAVKKNGKYLSVNLFPTEKFEEPKPVKGKALLLGVLPIAENIARQLGAKVEPVTDAE